jgi:hypothetical protein
MILKSGDFSDFLFLAKSSKKKLPKPLVFQKKLMIWQNVADQGNKKKTLLPFVAWV